MTFLDWSPRQLARVWLVALASSAACLALSLTPLGRPWKFFWLLPAPEGPADWLALAGRVAVAVTRAAPLVATGLVWIPLAAVGVTAAWGVRQVARRVRGA